jgi:hypothetical protein
MVEEINSLVVDHLKRIRGRLSSIGVDLGDLKTRVSSLAQYQGQVLTLLGGLNQRMDRFDEWMARIERRLDLVEV